MVQDDALPAASGASGMLPAKSKAITRRDVAALKPARGAQEAFIWDATVTGLGLRAYASGRKVWLLQYRDEHGRTRRIGLGDAKAIAPDAARVAAKAHLTQRAIGHDPATRRATTRHGRNVIDLIESYLASRRGHLRTSSLHETERQLRKYAAPLHREPVSVVKRGMIFELHRALTASSGPIQANRVLAALSSMFVWAMRAGLAESNPAALVPRNAEVARERVLSDSELAAIWHATGTGTDYARIVRLLMLTGCRREEIGGLRWDEIEGGMIVLGKDRTKTGAVHEVPLTELAMAQLPARTDRAFVFGQGADAGFSGWSKAKARLDASLGFEWRLHDLRRTLSTRLNEAGVDPHVVEALLGHTVKGVAGVYNRAVYRARRREALQTWAEHIGRLIS